MTRYKWIVAAAAMGFASGCSTGTLLPSDPPFCGDGIVLNAGEECDLGDANADDAACTSNCQLARCGDGLLYDAAEECDLGPANANDGACTASCRLAACGDGFLYAGEEDCDNGTSNGDDAACTSTCAKARCGDGLVWAGVEECDDGTFNLVGEVCTPLCRIARCGDGFLRREDEECDDGNPFGADGCGPTCRQQRVFTQDDADNRIRGESPDSRTGLQLTVLGDLDNDGRDDVGVMANAGVNDFVAHVLLDPLGISSMAKATTKLTGTQETRILGIEGVGDVDGDGRAEFALIVEYRDTQEHHGIHIFLDSPLGVASVDNADAVVLVSQTISGPPDIQISRVGDTNLDDRDDFLVVPRSTHPPGGGKGVAHLVTTVASGVQLLDDASSAVFLPEPGTNLVHAGPLGDVDGDGRADLFVQLVGPNGSGIYGFPGNSSGAQSSSQGTFVLEEAASTLGYARGSGDIDGDGWNDLVVAELRSSTELSRVHLFHGPLLGSRELTTSDFSITGELPGRSFVSRLVRPGDLNGDGKDEFGFASREDGFDTTTEGNAYLVQGPVSGGAQGRNSDVIIRLSDENLFLNEPRLDVGDVDGDGRADLVYAAPYDNEFRGEVFVLRGRTLFE